MDLPAPLTLTTERCRVEPLTPADAEVVFAYRSQPEVCRYLGHAAWTDLDQAREWITDSHAEGGGQLGIHADGVLVGDVMLRARPAAAVDGASAPAPVASLGYALHPDHQGKGLAREAVGAVVQAGFERWGLHRIEARVFTGARPSSRLLADLASPARVCCARWCGAVRAPGSTTRSGPVWPEKRWRVGQAPGGRAIRGPAQVGRVS
ncbi:hypothetical protein BJF82_05645 [Kytococcus sp. CUA-901]|nr:hypothetical protein BJF82_05645 [Kytococcus sp. CUA-901]